MIAVVPMHVRNLVIAPCRHGTFAFHQSDMIGSMLLTYGEWAEQEINFLSRFLRPGDTVIDVGAHMGTISIPLARVVGPGGNVFSFEAQRLLYYNLCTNITLNGISNIHAINAAVSSSDGHLNLREQKLSDAKNSGGYSIPMEVDSSPSEFVVRKIALDGFFLKTQECRLIKIDIEGHEPAALNGMRRFLQRTRPVVYVEANTRARFERVVAVLTTLNYRLFWHCEPHWNPQNFRGCLENHYGNSTDLNLVCFPDEWTGDVSLLTPAADFSEVEQFAARA